MPSNYSRFTRRPGRRRGNHLGLGDLGLGDLGLGSSYRSRPAPSRTATANAAAMLANTLLLRRLQGVLAEQMDTRRDIFKECGYYATADITAFHYRDLYDRDAIAGRVVEVLPRECWKVEPKIYEDEDSETVTEFEQAWDDLGKGLSTQSWYQDEAGSPIFEYLRRLDELSGVGHYGVLLIGMGDADLSQPAPGVEETNSAPVGIAGEGKTPVKVPVTGNYTLNLAPVPGGGTRKLLYLRVFDESLAPIVQWESNPSSPRYGQPVAYQLTFNDPALGMTGIGVSTVTRDVHWTRIIHVADNLGSSEVFGSPRMQCVLNHILNLQKIYGASGEGYWQEAFSGTALEGLPGVEFEAADITATQDMVEQYINGFQRYMILSGMTARKLAGQISDPTSQVAVHLQGICIKLAVPQRIFMGSERGELASGQDERAWNGRCQYRRQNHVTPRIVVPFTDRLIMLGCLPQPAGYSVDWNQQEELTKGEQADVLVKRTNAMAVYRQADLDALMAPKDYFTREMAFDEEEAESIAQNAIEGQQDETGNPLAAVKAEEQAKADEAAAQKSEEMKALADKQGQGQPDTRTIADAPGKVPPQFQKRGEPKPGEAP